MKIINVYPWSIAPAWMSGKVYLARCPSSRVFHRRTTNKRIKLVTEIYGNVFKHVVDYEML